MNYPSYICLLTILMCGLLLSDAVGQGCIRPHTTGPFCSISDPSSDPNFTEITSAEFGEYDFSSGLIPLQFTFNLYGDNYNSIYVNEKGHVTFGKEVSELSLWNYFESHNEHNYWTHKGFVDVDYPIIAPFFTQIKLERGGKLYYKSEPSRFTVVWYQVQYDPSATNTFKLVISDGNDPMIGVGNNVAFSYGDMQWACGPNMGNDEEINPTESFYGWPASVGMSKGDGTGSCYSTSLGYFNRPDNVDNGCEVPGDNYGQKFYDDNFNGINLLDNQCFAFNVAQTDGPNVGLNFSYETAVCATVFNPIIDNSNNCTVNSYAWDFGDGQTSTDPNPIHSYESDGEYSVELTISYQCGGCASQLTANQQVAVTTSDDLFKDTTITIQTQRIDQVLSASATTFSDAWPVDHPSEALNERPNFLNGSQGVWRQKESFVYDKPRERQSASEVNPAEDGYFTLETFNWQKANLRAIPNWLPANEVTKYSPYGYELENRDVLNRHSAALYGYGGQLPQAIGTNMRHDEMAYTGFEYLDNQRDGNWQLGTDPSPAYQRYEVETGRKRIVLVKAPLAALEDAEVVDVVAKRFFRPARYVAQNPIVCRYTHQDNPDWSVLVLERPVVDHIWWGHIILRGTPSPGISTTLDAAWTHSGKKSLKITSDLTLPQELLSLDSGKQYLLSAWVSVKNLELPEPKLADGIGLRLVATNADDQITLDEMFAPTGPVVEGWQQVRGAFTYPGEKATLALTFKKGTAATAWFDDLRLHPVEGNMQAYVYNPDDFRLQATLDENGYATLYYYDQEGNLYLTKKETERGIQTIQESLDYQAITNN